MLRGVSAAVFECLGVYTFDGLDISEKERVIKFLIPTDQVVHGEEDIWVGIVAFDGAVVGSVGDDFVEEGVEEDVGLVGFGLSEMIEVVDSQL